MAVEWLKHKCIVLENGEIREDLMLTVADRYKILGKIFEYECVDLKTKTELLNKEIELTRCDRSNRLRLECESALPDPENKEKIWNILINPIAHNLSTYDYSAIVDGFFKRSQKHLMIQYVDKFIEVLPIFADLEEKEYMTTFLDGICPRSPYITKEFLNDLNQICKYYERRDRIKYDTFLRILKGRYECLSGYEAIKRYAQSSHYYANDSDS